MSKNVSGDKQTYGMKAVSELCAIIESAMEDAGYKKDESRSIAETAVKAISFMAGGRQFYMPKGEKLKNAIRNSQILRDFTGNNVRELAAKNDLSEARIYTIIKSQIAAEKQGRQVNSQN